MEIIIKHLVIYCLKHLNLQFRICLDPRISKLGFNRALAKLSKVVKK